jgi:hypothetical protein
VGVCLRCGRPALSRCLPCQLSYLPGRGVCGARELHRGCVPVPRRIHRHRLFGGGLPGQPPVQRLSRHLRQHRRVRGARIVFWLCLPGVSPPPPTHTHTHTHHTPHPARLPLPNPALASRFPPTPHLGNVCVCPLDLAVGGGGANPVRQNHAGVCWSACVPIASPGGKCLSPISVRMLSPHFSPACLPACLLQRLHLRRRRELHADRVLRRLQL